MSIYKVLGILLTRKDNTMKYLFMKNTMIAVTCFTALSAMGMDLPEREDYDIEIFVDPADLRDVKCEDLDLEASFSSTEESTNKRSWSEREEDMSEDISQPPPKRARVQQKAQLPLFLESPDSGEIRSLKKGLCESIANLMDFAQMKQILLDVTPIEKGGSDDFLFIILDSMDMERLLQLWINLEEETSTNTTTTNAKDKALDTLKDLLTSYIQNSGTVLDLNKIEDTYPYLATDENLKSLLKAPFSKMVMCQDQCDFICRSEEERSIFAKNKYIKSIYLYHSIKYNNINDAKCLKAFFDLLSESQNKFESQNNINIKTLSLKNYSHKKAHSTIGNFIKKYPLETFKLNPNLVFDYYEDTERQAFYAGLFENKTIKSLRISDALSNSGELYGLIDTLIQRKANLESLCIEDSYGIAEGVHFVEAFRALVNANKGLKKLGLTYCTSLENDDFFELFSLLKDDKNITHLNFRGNHFRDLSGLLDFVQSNKMLKYINVSYCDIGIESYDLIESILEESPNLHLCILKQDMNLLEDEEKKSARATLQALKEKYGDRLS